MGDRPLLVLGVIALAIFGVLGFLTGRFTDQSEILRAETAAARLQAERDMLQHEVARRDSVQRGLEVRVDSLQRRAEDLRGEVAQLEAERASEQMEVRLLRTPADLQGRLVETFPELGPDLWRRTEVLDRENDIALEYLGAPLWFFETFILDAQNAASYRAQRDRLQQVDSLQIAMVDLQDSVITLGREKEGLYRAVYDSCYAEYVDLNERYVDLLKKPPRVTLGGGWIPALVAGGAGVFVGSRF